MAAPISSTPSEVIYPDSDGKPMSDNTKQFDLMVQIATNLRYRFADRAHEVCVGGDLLWYAVEGDPNERCAPDVYVIFGRPTKYRGSYKQWEEDNIPMTVVFEVLSPSNDAQEMARKFTF